MSAARLIEIPLSLAKQREATLENIEQSFLIPKLGNPNTIKLEYFESLVKNIERLYREEMEVLLMLQKKVLDNKEENFYVRKIRNDRIESLLKEPEQFWFTKLCEIEYEITIIKASS